MQKLISSFGLVAVLCTQTALAAINIPSNGSDGALVVTENTVIDLSLASTNRWDADNSARPGTGTYDADKWAVVFHYTSVSIEAGATVTFINHPSGAPVVWLVQSNVTINGTVCLDGEDGRIAPYLSKPGPGGSRGGAASFGAGAGYGDGFGVGGGGTAGANTTPSGGSYGSNGVGPRTGGQYGNASNMPLIGGSGGSGRHGHPDDGGGAGGGAILIACSSVLSIGGAVTANGGSHNYWASGGSGGAIRLVCETLSGAGDVLAQGGKNGNQGIGGNGRIRIERVTNTTNDDSFAVAPDPSVVELGDGDTPLIWLPTNGPTVQIVKIGGNDAPADPRAGFGAIGADVTLPQVTSTTVVIETRYVEAESAVTVRATPRSNGNYTEVPATGAPEVISENEPVLRWTVNVPVQDGYSAIQVKVVRP
ncbi:MAG TPA: hypothetical protein PKM43_12845 [Verrucomicrobiota bacterium]|nr:hypothetical protein [Verrucomicrobiota bacterium]